MEGIVIIPARMSATRFPGKPLAKIAGLSMIAHCYLRATYAKKITTVYVATCDEEIADEITQLGGQVIMTGSHHERASDRTAEALLKLENKEKIDVVVMLQGDEPLINPNDIDQLMLQHEKHPAISVFNLTQFIHNDLDFQNINTVKLLTGLNSDILAFSREPIPCARLKELGDFKPQKQLGVISFRREALIEFSQLSSTPIEKIESVDMMRFVEHGHSIRAVLTNSFMQGVDTQDDAKKVELLILQDDLYRKYHSLKTCKELIS